jgi:DNA-binding transcriptional MerR regulator
LAALVGMTARNVRAYQARGLMPGPTILGRVGYYDAHHVARLRLIQHLRDSGLNLDGIKYLMKSPSTFAALIRQYNAEVQERNVSLYVPLRGEVLKGMRAVDARLPESYVRYGLVVRVPDGGFLVHASMLSTGEELYRKGIPAIALHRLALDVSSAAEQIGRSIAAAADLTDANLPEMIGTTVSPETAAPAELRPMLVQHAVSIFEAALSFTVTGPGDISGEPRRLN